MSYSQSKSPAAQQILAEIGLGSIPATWSIVRIADLLSEDRGISVGVMYPGTHDPLGVPLIKAGDLANNRINRKPDFRITLEKHHEYRRTEFQGGEILLSLVGDVGRCAIVPTEMIGWNSARATALIRLADPSDAAFLRLCILSAPIQHLMNAWSTTTVQATLNLKEIRQIPIPWPPKTVRNRITEIAGSIDEKIELNRQMNETLEAMARRLFKSWFVDFDPVHAKARLRREHPELSNAELSRLALPNMAPEIAELFPDRFEDSTMGPIPKGWRFELLSGVSDVFIGKTPPRKEAKWFSSSSSDIPWMSIRDLGSSGLFIRETSEFLTEEAVNKFNIRRIPSGTVVFSFKLTVGRVAITDVEMLSNEAIAHFLIPEKAERINSEYLYCYLRSFNHERMGSTSSIATAVNSKMVKAIPILIPPYLLVKAFKQYTHSAMFRIKRLQEESRELQRIRDRLLPRLLSGELSVSGTGHDTSG